MTDPLILEAARARLRPFAVRAMRREVQLAGLGDLSTDTDFAAMAVEAAGKYALDGMLPNAGTMTAREFDAAVADIYGADGLAGLGLSWGDVKKKVKNVGKKLEDGAKKIGRKVEDVHKDFYKKVAVPIVAPTIANKLRQREDFKKKAAAARKKWIASGKTDAAALADYQHWNRMAKKRTDTVQKHVRTAGAVVAAVATAGAAAGPGATAAEVGKAVVIDQVKSAAADAVIGKVAQELAPDAQKAFTDYEESAAELVADDPVTDAAGNAQPESGGGGWVIPALLIAGSALVLG